MLTKKQIWETIKELRKERDNVACLPKDKKWIREIYNAQIKGLKYALNTQQRAWMVCETCFRVHKNEGHLCGNCEGMLSQIVIGLGVAEKFDRVWLKYKSSPDYAKLESEVK